MKKMADVSFKVLLLFLGVLSSVREAISYKGKEGYGDDNHGYYNNRPNKKEQKYYQDIYVAQLMPKELEFGHVKETPFSWEQRFEKINMEDNRHQGKVKWNDPKSGYGEFYYDFNHNNKGDDGGNEEGNQEGKKQTLDDILSDGRDLLEKGDVEFIDGKSLDNHSNGHQVYHGGNYKTDPNMVQQPNAIRNGKYKY